MAEETRWSHSLVRLRNVTKHAQAATVAICLLVMLFNWKDGLALLLFTTLQVWVYSYYGQRIAKEDASLPGPVSVRSEAKLSTRVGWDIWAMVFVALPAAGALLMLAKHTLLAAQ